MKCLLQVPESATVAEKQPWTTYDKWEGKVCDAHRNLNFIEFSMCHEILFCKNMSSPQLFNNLRKQVVSQIWSTGRSLPILAFTCCGLQIAALNVRAEFFCFFVFPKPVACHEAAGERGGLNSWWTRTMPSVLAASSKAAAHDVQPQCKRVPLMGTWPSRHAVHLKINGKPSCWSSDGQSQCRDCSLCEKAWFPLLSRRRFFSHWRMSQRMEAREGEGRQSQIHSNF